jgi:hypothetical protein
MNFTIRNLGAVNQAQINLKPLTIFVGANNTGKTWVAYTLAGILSAYGWREYQEAYSHSGSSKALDVSQSSLPGFPAGTGTFGSASEVYPPLEDAVAQILNVGNAKINVVEFADEFGERYLNGVVGLARSWMDKYMSTERASFENLEVRVELAETRSEFVERIRAVSHRRGISFGRQREKPLLSVLKERRDPLLYFLAEGNLSDSIPAEVIRDFVIGTTLEMLHRALYRDVHTFPTERTAYITIPFGSLELSTDASSAAERDAEKRLVDRPIFPVQDFLKLVWSAARTRQSEREQEARAIRKVQTYIGLADVLERDILAGTVKYSASEAEPRRDLLLRVANRDIELEMPIVSSMIKELAPLVLYLRYLAQPRELLVIDEPEMNLHPEAQARLTEFLAMLVHAGLHVLVTTHSPYVVDHLANLVKAAGHEDKESIKDKFYLQRPEAFIPREQVSVYLFEGGTARNIMDKSGVIDWGTFGRVSDRIAQIYFEL